MDSEIQERLGLCVEVHAAVYCRASRQGASYEARLERGGRHGSFSYDHRARRMTLQISTGGVCTFDHGGDAVGTFDKLTDSLVMAGALRLESDWETKVTTECRSLRQDLRVSIRHVPLFKTRFVYRYLDDFGQEAWSWQERSRLLWVHSLFGVGEGITSKLPAWPGNGGSI